MISISTRIDKQGFWYLVEANDNCNFEASYIVIGTGGRQGSGEAIGSSPSVRGWQYVDIGFPVLHVGITDLRITTPAPELISESRLSAPPPEPLSRRRAIRTLATSLLGGGALLFLPQPFSSNSALAGEMNPASIPPGFSGDPNDRYNPYRDERADAYRPY